MQDVLFNPPKIVSRAEIQRHLFLVCMSDLFYLDVWVSRLCGLVPVKLMGQGCAGVFNVQDPSMSV